MGVITFNSISSATVGINVETFPTYETPERDYESIHVPGRNGDVVIDTGTFKNVSRSYKVSMVVEPPAVSASGSIANFVTSKATYLSTCKCTLDYKSGGYSSLSVYDRGANMWDEQWEGGSLDINTGEPVSASGWGRSKNFFEVKPSTTYYGVIARGEMFVLEYGINKNYLGRYQNASNRTFSVSSDAYYLKFYTNDAYGTSYSHDISINYPSTITEYTRRENGSSVTINLSNLSETVYGGEIDVANGLVKSTKNSDGTTKSSPTYLSVNKETVSVFAGLNNVWSDYGTLEIETNSAGTYVQKMNKVAEWLHSGSGYCRLEDTYEPDYYTYAYYKQKTSFENLFNEAGRATLVFECKPQRYLKSGDNTTTFNAPGVIINPTNRTSLPIIIITTNNTTGSVTIGNCAFTVKDGAGTITVNSETQDVYTGTANKNSYITLVSGSFPTLEPGANTISFSGGVTKVEVIPKWWTT